MQHTRSGPPPPHPPTIAVNTCGAHRKIGSVFWRRNLDGPNSEFGQGDILVSSDQFPIRHLYDRCYSLGEKEGWYLTYLFVKFHTNDFIPHGISSGAAKPSCWDTHRENSTDDISRIMILKRVFPAPHPLAVLILLFCLDRGNCFSALPNDVLSIQKVFFGKRYRLWSGLRISSTFDPPLSFSIKIALVLILSGSGVSGYHIEEAGSSRFVIRLLSGAMWNINSFNFV